MKEFKMKRARWGVVRWYSACLVCGRPWVLVPELRQEKKKWGGAGEAMKESSASSLAYLTEKQKERQFVSG
jgi:hypothetical protein